MRCAEMIALSASIEVKIYHGVLTQEHVGTRGPCWAQAITVFRGPKLEEPTCMSQVFIFGQMLVRCLVDVMYHLC